MKVISGIFRGRNLDGFNIEGTRPTMDRVKESLFAIIQGYIKDSIVLDLFSGSGNLGIEALSEGAKYAYLVDKNINNLNINNVKVICLDYKKALYSINKKLDLIFLDPPYNTNYIKESIDLIVKLNLLSNRGLIICESDDLNKIIYPNSLKKIKEKKYGDKYIVLLEKNMC